MKLNEKKIKKLSSQLSTPLSGISFIFLAYALFTDRKVTQEEQREAIKNTLALGKLWEYTEDEVITAYGLAHQVCSECKMEETQAIFIDMLGKLYNQEGFNSQEQHLLVGSLELMMDADGDQHENELYWIAKIREFWQMDYS